jgi:hypothetical protein
MPGIAFLIAASITVQPASASTEREAPVESMKVIFAMAKPVNGRRSLRRRREKRAPHRLRAPVDPVS